MLFCGAKTVLKDVAFSAPLAAAPPNERTFEWSRGPCNFPSYDPLRSSYNPRFTAGFGLRMHLGEDS
jgi:hypothetical protein